MGQRASAVAKAVADLRAHGAMAYTIVMVSEGSDAPGLTYIAPYAATSIAEYFMEAGRDVLVVYDDLTQHARAYREISLLLRRPPGREAFPGDIFYIHSRLLERSTHLRSGSRRRLPHRPADHRNRGAGHCGLHSDQPYFHHGWTALSVPDALRARHPAGDRRRQIGVPGRQRRATGTLPCSRRQTEAGVLPVRGVGGLLALRHAARCAHPAGDRTRSSGFAPVSHSRSSPPFPSSSRSCYCSH